MALLGGAAIWLGAPAAFIVSLVGVFRDSRIGTAIAGLAVSGAAIVLLVLLPILFG